MPHGDRRRFAQIKEVWGWTKFSLPMAACRQLAEAGLQMTRFCASGAHVHLRTLRAGFRTASFLARPEPIGDRPASAAEQRDECRAMKGVFVASGARQSGVHGVVVRISCFLFFARPGPMSLGGTVRPVLAGDSFDPPGKGGRVGRRHIADDRPDPGRIPAMLPRIAIAARRAAALAAVHAASRIALHGGRAAGIAGPAARAAARRSGQDFGLCGRLHWARHRESSDICDAPEGGGPKPTAQEQMENMTGVKFSCWQRRR